MSRPLPAAAERSAFVTVVAWAMLIGGGLLAPISGLSLLMILAGSYGTNSTDLLGFLTVVIAPPAACVTGFGLLWRQSWAWYSALALLAFLLVVFGQQPSATTLVGIAVCLLLIVRWCSSAVRAELGVVFRTPATRRDRIEAQRSAATEARGATAERDWRVGHSGRDPMYYEEKYAGGWRRIAIDGEMQMGPAHHVIYFATPSQWQQYPEWARERREEIIDRITSEFRPPDYEYQSGGTARAEPRTAPARGVTRGEYRALAFVILLLIVVAGGSGWLVGSGLTTDHTWLPSPRASQTRIVSRVDEPASFWLAVSLYAAAALGSGTLALWCTREAWRLRAARG